MSNTPTFEIVTDVPLRSIGRKGGAVGPITEALRKLAAAPIGASLHFPGKRPAQLGPYIKSAVGARGVFVSRAEGSGARVWKIAEPPVEA